MSEPIPDKQRVKEALLAHLSAKLRFARGDTRAERAAAELDPDSSYSTDDQVQSDVVGGLSRLLEADNARQRALFVRVQALDFGPRNEVAPGALVSFGGGHYVVGVVSDEFECDGVSYEGISPESPIYAVIRGLREGDTFVFRGREQHIDAVA